MQSLKPWLKAIAYRELQERYAFYLEEPWGYDVDNYRMGILASVAANIAGNKTKAADFYPQPLSQNNTQTTASHNTDPQGLLDLFKSLQSPKPES